MFAAHEMPLVLLVARTVVKLLDWLLTWRVIVNVSVHKTLLTDDTIDTKLENNRDFG